MRTDLHAYSDARRNAHQNVVDEAEIVEELLEPINEAMPGVALLVSLGGRWWIVAIVVVVATALRILPKVGSLAAIDADTGRLIQELKQSEVTLLPKRGWEWWRRQHRVGRGLWAIANRGIATGIFTALFTFARPCWSLADRTKSRHSRALRGAGQPAIHRVRSERRTT